MYEHLLSLQNKLAKKVIICPYKNNIRLIGGVDVSFERFSNTGFCSFVVLNKKFEIVEVKNVKLTVKMPYVPGLLSFRELPLIYQAYKKLSFKPDIVFCDSQGIAHPRGLGLASHLGVVLNIPVVGCAKSRLVGEYNIPGNKKGNYTYLKYRGENVGAVLITKDNCKPMFISPGHLIDIKTSILTVLKFTKKYKIPEPTRVAHILSNSFRREDSNFY